MAGSKGQSSLLCGAHEEAHEGEAVLGVAELDGFEEKIDAFFIALAGDGEERFDEKARGFIGG